MVINNIHLYGPTNHHGVGTVRLHVDRCGHCATDRRSCDYCSTACQTCDYSWHTQYTNITHRAIT